MLSAGFSKTKRIISKAFLAFVLVFFVLLPITIETKISAQYYPTITPEINDKQAEAREEQRQIESGDDNLPTCDITFVGKSKIMGCFAQAAYYVFYFATAWVAGLFGNIFDFFMGYSLSDEAYRYDFVVTGWKLVRDIANIIFIIIMVWTGIAAIFDLKGGAGSNMKRIIPALIINALIINFSLFATRVVIDISNITARIFYSRMIVCSGKCEYVGNSSVPTNIKRSPGGYWPISEKIVSGFDPQKMFTPAILDAPTTQTDTGSTNAFGSTNAGQRLAGSTLSKDSNEYAAYYTLVSILAGGIMIAIAIMFWKTGFFFIGRVIGLYVAMIFSPFAFLTLNGGGGFFKIESFEWSSWVKDLSTYAMLAPIFTFFLYIINVFFESDLVTQLGLKSNSGNFFETLIEIAIPMIFVFMLIKVAQDKATDYAGKIGKKIQGFAEKTIGTVGGLAAGGVGIAAGGAAFLGSRVGAQAVGALGKVGKNGGLSSWAARNAATNRFANWTNTAFNKAQTGTWDVRNTAVGKFAGNQLAKGANFVDKQMGGTGSFRDTISTRVGLGADAQKGGRIARIKEKESEQKKKLEKRFEEKDFSHLSKEEAQKLFVQIQEQKIEKRITQSEPQITRAEDNHVIEAIKQKLSEADDANKESFNKERALTRQEAAQQKNLQDLNDRLAAKDISEAEKKDIGTRIANMQASLSATIESLSNVQRVNTEKITKAQADKATVDEIKASAEYKQIRNTAQENIKKEVETEYAKFGEIKSGKDLATVMQYDYVNGVRENSEWMKNGAQRNLGSFNAALQGALTGVGFATGAVAGPAGMALGAGLGAAIGNIITGNIKEGAAAVDAASKKILEDIEKRMQKNVKAAKNEKALEYSVEQYENEVDTIEKQMKAIFEKEVVAGRNIESLSEAEKKEIIDNEKINKQAEYDISDINYGRLKNEAITNQDITQEQIRQASIARKKAQDELHLVTSLLDRYKKANEGLSRANASLNKELERAERAKNSEPSKQGEQKKA